MARNTNSHVVQTKETTGRSNDRNNNNSGRNNNYRKGDNRRKDGPAPTKNGVKYENALVEQLYTATKGCFEKGFLDSVLRDNENSVEKSLDVLNKMNENSWANKVKKVSPFVVPSADAPNNNNVVNKSGSKATQPAQVNQTTTANQKNNQPSNTIQNTQNSNNQINNTQPQKNTNNNNNNKNKKIPGNNNKEVKSNETNYVEKQKVEVPKPLEEEYNADAKIEALQKQFENKLNSYEKKKQLLTSLQHEVSFTADRDFQIETLTNEKDQLINKKKLLEEELLSIQRRSEQIDLTIAHLKQEKVQKIRFLEEKSRSFLDEKL